VRLKVQCGIKVKFTETSTILEKKPAKMYLCKQRRKYVLCVHMCN